MTPKIPAGRREADQLLLLLLRQNGCSVPKGVSSVSQLSSDAVIEAVGSLIMGIDGSPPLPEASSTRGYHPADRHRACLTVASRVREAGYSEPLSAHQLLYPAEGSTRQLLLALLNMLPPDGAPPPPPPPSASVSGTQISPTPGASEEQRSDLLSGELPEEECDSERQQPGEPGSVQNDGTENRADVIVKDSPDFVDEEQATSSKEPGKSSGPEGTGESKIQPSKQRTLDEEGQGKKEDDGEDKRNESRQGQDAVTGASGEDEAAESGNHREAAEPLSGDPASADTDVGDAAGGQRDESEKGEGGVDDFKPGDDNRRLEQQQHDEEEEEHAFGGHARLEALVDEGAEIMVGRETAVSVVAEEGAEAAERVEECHAGLQREQAIDEAQDREQQRVASTPDGEEAGSVGGEKKSYPKVDPDGDHDPKKERGDGEGSGGMSPFVFRKERNGETLTALDSASKMSNAEADRRTTPSGESCDAALVKTEGIAAREDPGERESHVTRHQDPKGEESVGPAEEGEKGKECEASPNVEVEGTAPLGGGVVVGVEEDSGEDSSEDDIVFLQFEVDAQEVELNRLLGAESIASQAADKLEEEVRNLSALAEERETHCRYAAKALELLPNAADESDRLQREITTAESRIQAAQKAFAKTMKPLEEVVRVQREELARRKARCRDLLDEIRSKYDESEEMSGQESLLRAAARDMERWERRKRGDIVIDGEEGEDDREDSWVESILEEDAEEAKRRKAEALLRADIDARIASLCDEALAQKQEIVISLSEVLDSRRETNAAWDLLGRAEALAEEKLFLASKEAVSSNKDRARELIEAYKGLHVVDGVFSSLVEAVSDLTKREEECQLVEDETTRMVSQHGGSSLMLLPRDLKRVREDAFALEQRLDELLEEQRLQQEARQEAERLERERKAAEEKDASNVIAEGVETIEEGLGGATSLEQDVGFGPEPTEERQEEADGEKGLDEEEHFDESGAAGFEDSMGNEGRRGDDEVDFIGEEEEDNVWQ